MIIRHSLQLLEHLTELEAKIQNWEKLMEELGVEFDREKLLRMIVSGQKAQGLLPKKN